jgi:aspartyl-tRNA(Asn)/glutamyl-tRNA(Gln) amidotransferase subunit C
MAINEKEVQHIAKLARLYLKPEEIKKIGKQLSLILDYFNLLEKVDINNVKSDSDLMDNQKNLNIEEITRKDLVIKAENTKEIMKLIPEKEDRFVKVKSILNK